MSSDTSQHSFDDAASRDPMEVLAEEFLERYRAGESPDVEEYVARYPDLANEIRDFFPTLMLLEAGREDASPHSVRQVRAPERLGDYRILSEVGRGGMGIVYEAEHESLGRRVALKVLNERLGASDSQRRRFEREVRTAARLHHTCIVPVFGVGEAEGMHYYVMQFIEGASLHVVLDQLKAGSQLKGDTGSHEGEAADSSASGLAGLMVSRRMERPHSDSNNLVDVAQSTDDDVAADRPPSSNSDSGRQSNLSGASRHLRPQQAYHINVARVGCRIAEALAYAHQQNVLHRDVKPENLLLDRYGHIWVTDFGLAHAEHEPDLTKTGDVLGTLRYIAPEAFHGQVDRRSDIFSLGLTLYEMITLRPAYEEHDRRRLVAKASAATIAPLLALRPDVNRDLATIVQKAIEPEPSHRYQTASELAADLRRFLNDEPIQARRPSLAERLWRWSRRNRSVAALLLLIAVLLLTGTVVSALAAARFKSLADSADAARIKEVDAKQDALAARNDALIASRDADKARIEAVAAKEVAESQTEIAEQQQELAERRAKTIRHNLYASQMQVIARLWEYSGGVRIANSLLADWMPQDEDDDLRGFEWFYLRANVVQSTDWWGGDPWTASREPILCVACSPDGTRHLSGGAPGKVDVWDAETHERLLSLPQQSGQVTALAWSPDNSRFATGGTKDSRVHIWDANSGEQIAVAAGHVDDITGLAWSPDGVLASSSRDGSIRLWNQAGQAIGAIASESPLSGVCWSPDGIRLATFDGTTEVQIYGRDGEAQRTLTAPSEMARSITSLAWSPDGGRLAASTSNQTIVVWHLGSGASLLDAQDAPISNSILRGHQNTVQMASWSPDGKYLASVGDDLLLLIWDMQSNGIVRRLFGHSHHVTAVAWNPDGNSLITGSIDQSIREWRLQDPNALVGHTGSVATVAFDPRGKLLATGGKDRTIRIWDVAARRELRVLRGHQDTIHTLSWSSGGRVLASGSYDKSIRLWNPDTGELLCSWSAGDDNVNLIAWHKDGSRLAVVGNGAIGVWETKMTPPSLIFRIERAGLGQSVAWSPDGTRLAAGVNADIQIFDAADGTLVRTLPGKPRQGPHWVCWSPDGSRVASVDYYQNLLIWDAVTSELLIAVPRRHTMPTTSIAWSPDGSRIASTATDNTLRLSDAKNGAETLVLTHSHYVYGVAWSPDGLQLASASADGTCRIWDSSPGYDLNRR